MKKATVNFSLLLFVVFIAGCGNYRIYSGSVNYDASKFNSIIKSSELNTYLSNKDKLSFVLRTPSGLEGMDPEEQLRWNTISSQIEKEIIRKGHIIKDRKLMETLIDKGALVGQSYLEALETDILIELINVAFDIPNPMYDFSIHEKRIRSNFNNWDHLQYIDCRMAFMECRITLVESGQTGGIFRFYISGCDESNDFFLKLYENPDGTLNPEKEAFVGWNLNRVEYASLTHSYDLNDASRNKAIERLVSALIDTLLTENIPEN